MKRFIAWDIELFKHINGQWTADWLDQLFTLSRNPFFWSPLYLFLCAFLIMNYGKRGWWWIAYFLVTFALTDFISASIIKPWVGRIRPCHDPELAHTVRMLVGCGGRLSFVSSHAANHFGLSTYLFITFRHIWPKGRWIFFAWAALVAYAQVYVGLHFPLDIVGGALLGLIIGYLTADIYKIRLGNLNTETVIST